jgi:hypothetical protein
MLPFLSTQVRLTTLSNLTVEDLIPSSAGGFGTAQFQPVVSITHHYNSSAPAPSTMQPATEHPARAAASPTEGGGRHLKAATPSAPTPSKFGPLPGPPSKKPPSKPVPVGTSANSTNAADYAQCGGMGETCPLADQSLCADAQYLDCAASRSVCVRLSRFMWECLPLSGSTVSGMLGQPAPAPAPKLKPNRKTPPSEPPSRDAGKGRKLLQAAREADQAEASTAGLLRPGPITASQAAAAGTPIGATISSPAISPTPSKFGRLPGPKQKLSTPPQPVALGDSANSTNVPDFSQCGGIGETCPLPNQSQCTDAPYLKCIEPASICVRLSKWYWQCMPRRLSPPLPESSSDPGVPDYGQCGGKGNTCPLTDRSLCHDAQYLECAGKSSRCNRINAWYWQCRSMQTMAATDIKPAASPAEAPHSAVQAAGAPANALRPAVKAASSPAESPQPAIKPFKGAGA